MDESSRRRHEGGSAMLAVVLTLAAITLLLFVVSPLAFLEATLTKEEQTRRQLAMLVEAVAGSDEKGTFGFIGDLGRLPKSLAELNDQNPATQTLCDNAFNPAAPPSFHSADSGVDHRGRIGLGWRGPYVKETFFSDDHLKDAWGQALRYTCSETTRASTDPIAAGVAFTFRSGQITSAGPDGAFDTQDDIKSDQFHDRGNLFLTITQGNTDMVAQSVKLTLYLQNRNGEQTFVQCEAVTVDAPEGSQKTVAVSSLPAGVHFGKIFYGPQLLEFYTLTTRGNVTNRLELKIPIAPGGGGQGGGGGQAPPSPGTPCVVP